MGAAYNAGQAFADALSNSYANAKQQIANTLFPGAGPAMAVGRAVAPAFGDFLSGATGGAAPLSDTATVHLPPARAVAVPVAVKAAPAAAAKPAATPAAAKAADPMAGLGKLSFNQLVQLSEVADHTAQRGTAARPPSAPDAAGTMLASIYQAQFQNTLKAAGNDPAKQKAATDAFEQKMLPIALKGNTADEYLYGGQGQ